MNLPVHTTDTLLLDTYQGVSVLEAFVHTILFHRMGQRMARPIEVAHPLFESLVYVHGGDDAVSERVSERVQAAMETLKERATGTVVVVFYHIRHASGWFGREEWTEVEKWRIPVQWYASYDRSLTPTVKENRVRAVYEGLLRQLMGATLDPVPFALGTEQLPFDVVDGDASNRLKDILQLVLSGPPTMGGLFS